MRKLYTTLLFILGLLPLTGWSQVLSWNLTGAAGNEPTIAATTADPHLNSSSLSRGPGIAASGLTKGFAANTWTGADQSAAESAGNYFQFTVNTLAGYKVSLSTIDVYLRRSGTGPNAYQWEYSLDGFASAGSPIGGNISFTDPNSNGVKQPQLDLSGVAGLQNVENATITIRLYAWGATGGSGSFAIGKPASDNSLSIGGTVTATSTGGGGATITATPATLSGFTTTAGTPSTAQSATIGGSALTDDITVTAPGGYEVATNAAGPFSSSLMLTRAIDGSVNASVFVRINALATAGNANGNLTAGSAGAATQTVVLSGTVNAVTPPAANIVINQVYGGGGNSGAPYTYDYIELYNNEASAVNLNGWSIQYASATSTGNWAVSALTGTIPAHGFFLIQEATNSTSVGSPLPGADFTASTGALNFSATSGKVLLSNSATAKNGSHPSTDVIDLVGYGTANGHEGDTTAPALSNTTSIVRVTDGLDNDKNATDFKVIPPLPRNAGYTTSAPVILTFNPAKGTVDLPVNFVPSLVFNKQMVKGSGTVTITGDPTPIDINDPSIVITTNSVLTINRPLTGNTHYTITISSGALKDIYGNVFAGESDWSFTTYNNTAAAALDYTNNFDNCTGTGLLPGGFTQFSVTGPQTWDCTPFGRDPAAPTGTAPHPNAVQINGFANGANLLNEDWLISPRFDLSATNFPLLSFWSRNAFAGSPLQLKISTDYSGTGSPAAATWTDLNGKFPSVGSDTWTQSSNINLSDYKSGQVYLAFVYTSTTDDGSRWTLDDISLVNSLTPPPPSLTLSSSNFEFGYAASGSTVEKTLNVIGNDLTSDITVTAHGNFLVSTDDINFSNEVTIGADTANNKTEPVFIRFAPDVDNSQFFDSLHVAISDSTATVNVKGNSISPASTLSVVDWNLNWFATPEVGFGPTDKALQQANVKTILPSLHADLYVLQEVVNEAALASIVADMPGYSYVINNYGSHSNLNDPVNYPLNTVQKLAFVYNIAKIKNIRTDSLLSSGTGTTTDLTTRYYSDWAGGRYPYMLTADVTLDNNGTTTTKSIHFINIHAKANTGDIVAAYNSRKNGAFALDSLIKVKYLTDNVMVLGDFNDDLNQTITAGINPPVTSYSAFTINDESLYHFPTKTLSQQGQHSDVNYTSVIDNVIVNNSMANWYLPSSATVLSDVSSLVPNYGTTTTDHYPVFTQFSFTPPVALPVKLLNFTAVRQDATSKLNWATSEENNSASFGIERSGDNVKFSAIGTVAAQGTSTTTTNYSFIDGKPLTGNNYYRLKQVDLDGKSTYSKTVVLNFGSSFTLHISPNPAHGTANLFVSSTNEAFSIQIVNLNGQTVKQLLTTPGTANIPVDISGLAKGIYTVKVISATSVVTQKLLVQ